MSIITLITININIIINNGGLYLSEELTRILQYTFSTSRSPQILSRFHRGAMLVFSSHKKFDTLVRFVYDLCPYRISHAHIGRYIS